jgi:hypothetical protein
LCLRGGDDAENICLLLLKLKVLIHPRRRRETCSSR